MDVIRNNYKVSSLRYIENESKTLIFDEVTLV
jgi:hypothetical protein